VCRALRPLFGGRIAKYQGSIYRHSLCLLLQRLIFKGYQENLIIILVVIDLFKEIFDSSSGSPRLVIAESQQSLYHLAHESGSSIPLRLLILLLLDIDLKYLVVQVLQPGKDLLDLFDVSLIRSHWIIFQAQVLELYAST
jgi:hypothetical protein